MTNEDKEKLGAVVGTAGGFVLGYLLGRKKKVCPYQCIFCGLTFATSNELKTHICTHCAPPTQWITCYPTQYWYRFGKSGPTWEEVHDSPTGDVGLLCNFLGCGSQTGWIWYKNPLLYRSALFFDLSPLPQGKLILSANLNAHFLHNWKFGDGGCTLIPNSHILLDFPTCSWPPSGVDYGKFLTLTDEIIRWDSATSPFEETTTVPLPQHTINTMQGMPRLAIAEMCSADHDGPGGTYRTVYGCNTQKDSGGYVATLYVEVEP